MSPLLGGPDGPESGELPGRRDVVRTLAGIGAAGMSILGQSRMASAGLTSELNGSAVPGSESVIAAKKKKKKHTLSQNTATNTVPAGGNANAQANCLSGEVTGGGVGVTDTTCRVISSAPVGTAAWGATVACVNSATMTVTVICLG